MYLIIESDNIYLQKQINKLMESDWLPIGGIQFRQEDNITRVYQSMLKIKTNKEK